MSSTVRIFALQMQLFLPSFFLSSPLHFVAVFIYYSSCVVVLYALVGTAQAYTLVVICIIFRAYVILVCLAFPLRCRYLKHSIISSETDVIVVQSIITNS